MDEGQTINFYGVNWCRKYITYLSHPLPHIKQWHTWHQRKPHDLQHFKIAGEQDIFCMFSLIKLMQCQIFPRYIYMFSPVGQNHWQSLEGLEIKTSLLFPGVLHANPRFLSNSANLKWLNANFFKIHTEKGGKNYNWYWYNTNSLKNIIALFTLSAAPNSHPPCIHKTFDEEEKPWKATSGGTETAVLQSVQVTHCHNLISLQLPVFCREAAPSGATKELIWVLLTQE